MVENELKEYANLLWKRWWLIALAAVLAGAAAYLTSAVQPPVYQAETTVQIVPGVDPSRDPFSVAGAADKAAATYVAQINSSVILCAAAEQLDLRAADCGAGLITVQQLRDTHLIQITARSTTPTMAQAHADAVAEVFIQRELTQQRERFQSSLDELDLQIEGVEASIAEKQRAISALNGSAAIDDQARQERAMLQIELSSQQQRLTTLLGSAEEFRLAMARFTDYLTVFSPAQLPVAPVGPAVGRNALLGLAVGAMLGVGVVFLIEYLDDTVKSPDQVRRTLSTAVLGVLPAMSTTNGHSPGLVTITQPRQPVAEAFRNLRTSIRYASVDRQPRSILVTSPMPNDGKSFTAANLAVSLAQSGQSVILVDADLRRPVAHKLFGVVNGLGLTTALLHLENVEPALKPTSVDNLRLITAGTQVPNPTELMSSGRMRSLVAWLGERADVVILDSPPLLAFADAAVLSGLVDSTVLVVEYGATRWGAASRAVDRLAEVGGNLLGVVINQVAPDSGEHYYYYYSYYEHYGADDGENGDGRRRRRSHEQGPAREKQD